MNGEGRGLWFIDLEFLDTTHFPALLKPWEVKCDGDRIRHSEKMCVSVLETPSEV